MDTIKPGAEILAEFVQGYLSCALWASSDEDEIPLDANYGIDDITTEATTEATEDCSRFIEANMTDLLEFCRIVGDGESWSAWERAGHDFWLTRCGHGTGYWDRGLGELGDRLTEAAEGYGCRYVLIDDDNKLYIQ